MGWTKEHRLCLQQAADNGDEAAALELKRMRARNVENKRRSDARLRAQRKNKTSVSKAVSKRLLDPRDDAPVQNPPPPARLPAVPPMENTEVMDPVGSSVVDRPREVVANDSKRSGSFTGFEGVRWKPLAEVRGKGDAKIELEKARVLDSAVKERKKALKRMIKGKAT